MCAYFETFAAMVYQPAAIFILSINNLLHAIPLIFLLNFWNVSWEQTWKYLN